METSNIIIEQYCETYNLKNLIKKSTCFKNIDNPSCIDLILTNHYKCSQYSDTKKQRPRIMKYRDYAKFHNNKFRAELVQELSFKSSPVNQFKEFIDIT